MAIRNTFQSLLTAVVTSIAAIIPFPHTPDVGEAEGGHGVEIQSNRLFALLIGINTYNDTKNASGARARLDYDARNLHDVPTFTDLRGAVGDADKFQEYLVSDLRVPTDHIKVLRDEEATRGNIINEFQQLASNKNIKKGDSIFIFYAGHGAQALPPGRLAREEGCPKHVELLIPHDYLKNPEKHKYMGIPDYSLAVLLNDIAKEKGDNITIVFDCCHSASGLRGGTNLAHPQDPDSAIVRSGPELKYRVPDDLDEDIWGPKTKTKTRGITVLPPFEHLGPRSYVFFAACASAELAREKSNEGCFTQALLGYLRQLGPDVKVPCSELITSLPKIDGQHPQCEGLHKNRPIFHGYTPLPRKNFFDVISNGTPSTSLTLKGGEAHGLFKGDELTVFESKSDADHNNSIGIVGIKELFFDTSSLELKSESSLSSYPRAVALLTKPVQKDQYLKLYIDEKDQVLRSRVDRLKVGTLTDDLKEAHIKLSIEEKEDKKKICFEVADCDLLSSAPDLKLQPRFEPYEDGDGLALIIKGLSHYYWHLKRSSHSLDSLIKDVSISFFELQDTHGHPRIVKANGSRNLSTNGVVDLKVKENAIYGLEVNNDSEERGSLFPVLFYFDNKDFTITQSFPDLVLGENAESQWPDTGQPMTIGYGLGSGSSATPFSFEVSEGHDMEAGFFKLFLFDKATDLQSVVQEKSPFVEHRGMYQKTLQALERTTPYRWGSIALTVIQRRE